MTNPWKARLRIGITTFVVLFGALYVPKRTKASEGSYWYCSDYASSPGTARHWGLFSNDIFANTEDQPDKYAIERGYQLLVRRSGYGGGTADCDTSHASQQGLDYLKKEKEQTEKDYSDKGAEIRATKWQYHSGDEKEKDEE